MTTCVPETRRPHTADSAASQSAAGPTTGGLQANGALSCSATLHSRLRLQHSISRLSDSESEDEGDESGERSSALTKEDEQQVLEYMNDICNCYCEDKFWRVLNQVVVPVTMAHTDKLGIHVNGIPIEDIETTEQLYLDNKVTKVDPTGIVGLWNECNADTEANVVSHLLVGVNLYIDAVVDLSTAETFTGKDAVRYLQSICCSFREGRSDDARLRLSFLMERFFEFNYKGRPFIGTALHIAALSKGVESELSGEQLLWMLVEIGVDLTQECHYASGSCQAIHLAAGRGNRNIVKMLVASQCYVDAKTNYNNAPHYTALHEACFFQQTEMVSELLKQRASVNATNNKGQTPLHIAAIQGMHNICQLLVEAGANITATDTQDTTPLVAAMESGRFLYNKLFHLTGRTLKDLYMVAQLSAMASSEMLRDRNNLEADLHDSWTRDLKTECIEKDGMSTWIQLMAIAPKASEEVIQALTARPHVHNEAHHPLPKRASLPEGKLFLCDYQPFDYWACNADQELVFPKWHKALCPGIDVSNQQVEKGSCKKALCSFVCGREFSTVVPVLESGDAGSSNQAGAHYKGSQTASRDLVPVEVRVLYLPGVLCPHVMHALATVKDQHIFGKISVQAIVEYTWTRIVRHPYYCRTYQRLIVVAVLFAWVLAQHDLTQTLRRACWSILTAITYLEIFREICEAVGYWRELDRFAVYFRSGKNIFDYLSIGIGLTLCYATYSELKLEDWPILFSVLVMGRWLMLMWTCRAFNWAGPKIMPIMEASMAPMTGILAVTGFCFLGFWHSFAALQLGHGGMENIEVLLASVRLLLLGDGDGIDAVLALYDGAKEGNAVTFVFLSVSVLVFCICVLNLFIAVHGEAYDEAQEKSFTSFLQQRVGVCLHAFLMPRWPPPRCPRLQNPKLCSLGVYLLTLVAWALLVFQTSYHPVFASAALVLGSLLAEALMMQLPWDGREEKKHFLWICFRSDYDEKEFCPSDSVAETIEGRLGHLRKISHGMYRKLGNDVLELKKGFEEQSDGLEASVTSIEQKLVSLSGLIGAASAKLKQKSSRPSESRIDRQTGFVTPASIGSGTLGRPRLLEAVVSASEPAGFTTPKSAVDVSHLSQSIASSDQVLE
eukprot:TRINITY_DN42403_c0_g1_i1.p1 TRINITY_DN42403_c0_g1~~TRINITY_DN42403_c0_g1_i1.p1  ORF type:complete len:1122 (+),score=150.55 TRINITY_DN42403_c0_g1_i1:88-3453(+)